MTPSIWKLSKEIMMARGGKREGAGRKPGSANKLTVQQKRTLREIADGYTDEAIGVLADIMRDAEAPHAARATAANSILDRAHGKPKQSIETEIDLGRLTDEQAVALAIALGASPDIVEGFSRPATPPRTH